MIERLLGDTFHLARRGAARATDLSVRVLRRLNAVLDPRRPLDAASLVPAEALAELERLIGGDGQAEDDVPERVTEDVLRDRFQALLERSREPVPPEGEPHPAFERIVDSLSPDEARIVVLLCEDGPQPVIAVRSTARIGSGQQTILDNVSLVGERAGCHIPERSPAYIDNLCRLGVTERHDEELVGNEDYEVLASRGEVADAEETIREERNQRPLVDRGQLRLTRLGELLCEVCVRASGGGTAQDAAPRRHPT